MEEIGWEWTDVRKTLWTNSAGRGKLGGLFSTKLSANLSATRGVCPQNHKDPYTMNEGGRIPVESEEARTCSVSCASLE